MDTKKLHLQEELIDINKIIPYQNNYKTHPAKQVDLLASHIAESGWDQPIVVDSDMVIIKGHGRLMAAKKLGLKQVPVKVRSDLSESQVKAARIADNKLSELAKDDTDLLALDLKHLEGDGFILESLGFSEKDLIKLGIKDSNNDGQLPGPKGPGL